MSSGDRYSSHWIDATDIRVSIVTIESSATSSLTGSASGPATSPSSTRPSPPLSTFIRTASQLGNLGALPCHQQSRVSRLRGHQSPGLHQVRLQQRPDVGQGKYAGVPVDTECDIRGRLGSVRTRSRNCACPIPSGGRDPNAKSF